MKAALAAVAAALMLAVPASALAKTTKNFEYQSSGSAVGFGAVIGLGMNGTYEDYPFTIAPDETNGKVEIEVHWDNPADDWDLYVYKKNAKGELDQVGSSAGAPPSPTESTVIEGQGGPLEAGQYVIRVQNYAATSPNFAGSAKFTEFVVANVKPTAKLKAPKRGKTNKAIKLDASGSKDSDGTIASYRFDLDGDGSMETDGGTNPVLKRKFKAGVHRIGVRVTDNKGARAYARATVRVTKAKKKHKKKR